MAFDAKKVKEDIIIWIREFFEQNGKVYYSYMD